MTMAIPDEVVGLALVLGAIGSIGTLLVTAITIRRSFVNLPLVRPTIEAEWADDDRKEFLVVRLVLENRSRLHRARLDRFKKPSFQCVKYTPVDNQWRTSEWYMSEWVQFEGAPALERGDYPDAIFRREPWAGHPVKIFESTLWFEPGERITVERTYHCFGEVAVLKLGLQVSIRLSRLQSLLARIHQRGNRFTTTLTVIRSVDGLELKAR